MQALGERMAGAVLNKQDFDAFWVLRSPPLACRLCGRGYKHRGWLRRHYWKTGHWREGQEVKSG